MADTAQCHRSVGMNSNVFASGDYWEARYRTGGTSGAGSYGRLAQFKADFVNEFVADNMIAGVLDLGCGDGNLLSLLNLPAYTGVDVSATALTRCADRFGHRLKYAFVLLDHLDSTAPAELSLSIDVIFHLTEDTVFERHMSDLFGRATRFVIVYASNYDSISLDPHVRHRRFSDYVVNRWPKWQLLAHVPNRFPYDHAQPNITSFADFFVYSCKTETCVIRVPAASWELHH
jgi:SAM-dependent methyltransferase